jgi:hypothetical protein
MKMRVKVISFTFLTYLLLTGYLAGVDSEFQSHIARSYPGFKILSPNEFERSISTETPTPGLVIGQFNYDSLQDFACLIRAAEKKWDPGGYYYYEGKFVVCHGLEDGGYQCLELSSMPISVPYFSYLLRAAPQKTYCCSDNGKVPIDVKTDAIAWYVPEKGGSHYIYQSDGSYLNCVVSD